MTLHLKLLVRNLLFKAFIGLHVEIKAVDPTVLPTEEEEKALKTGWTVDTVACVVMAIFPSLCGN